jgi:DNA-binding transcriptional MocR family regulator
MAAKYVEVMDHIKGLIQSGSLASGRKVPSIRDICTTHGCSKATVLRAYDELQKESILYSVPKSGYYVVVGERNGGLASQKKTSVDSSVCSYYHTAPEKGESVIDFSATSPCADASQLPSAELNHSISHTHKTYAGQLFHYPPIQGLSELRQILQKHLQNQQVFANVENIFLTSGTQQTLYMLSKMPFPNGKQNVLVEQPTFFGIIKALELNHVKALGIRRTICGINMDELERIFRSGDIKFFYIVPRFQNPTGFSYTSDEKKKILALADKYDVYIVEDDYLADLELNTKCTPMFSEGLSGRVIYLKSFSKTLMPGLRISVAVLPSLLVNKFTEYKAFCDIGPNILSQGILDTFIRSGMYHMHIRQIKELYSSRMKYLREVCASNFPTDNRPAVPETGLFTMIELPRSLNSTALAAMLQYKSVLVTSIEEAFLPEYKSSSFIRISICKVDEKSMAEGIRIISETIKDQMRFFGMNARFSINSMYVGM